MNIFNKVIFFIRKAVFSTIGLMLILTVGVSLAVWFVGPLLAIGEWRPFVSTESRIIFIVVWMLLIVIITLTIFLLRRRREKKLEEKIAKGPVEPVAPLDSASQTEIDELQTRMKEALQILRRSRLGGRGGRKSLYQLPWYIIIGPPGAGKTTAIVNSGLKFPLAEKMGKAAVVGVGGTRNCDWWFTNESVLIDTAGRYTTQESDADQDAKSWLGFLDILKKSRTRQPINGAVVAISLSDLSLQDEATRRNHALAIRTRLRELREKLNVRFPVYVLFTKADLMAGFAEFFERLGKDEREQVWGVTFPLEKGADAAPALSRFDAEFDALLGRLNDRSVELMQQEVDHRRRSLIYGFPQQVESLRAVARDFLGEVFQESRFEDGQLLRGLYFTSGTQEGTPIDRLMRGMAQAFGIGRQAVGSGQGSGKSFFLTRLLGDVIFGEAGLVSADDRVERRYKWVMRGAVAAGVIVTGLFAGLWTMSYLGNRELIASARAEIDRYREATAEIQINPVEDIDLPAIVPPLNILRDMPGNPTVNDPEPPFELTFGLYQGDQVGTEAAQTYRAALNKLLLPRLLLRLEKQMQSNLNNPDLLFQALKVYLMLGLQGPIDEEMIEKWMELDWALGYPGGSNEAMRADLAVHLEALLGSPMQEIQLNGNLVSAVRGILADQTLAERVYQSIITSPEAEALPHWRITQAGGPQTTRVLVRPSGEPLSEGVEGIYTYLGFTEVFRSEALGMAERMQREAWVLGENSSALTDLALGNLTRDVLNLYYDDYVARWDRILADLDIVPPSSLNDAVRVTNILSGANSPIKNILESIAAETELTRTPEVTDGTISIDDATTSALGSVLKRYGKASVDSQTRDLLAAMSGGNSFATLADQNGELPPLPGQYVEDQFAWLRELTDSAEGVPSRLDEVIALMGEVKDELTRLGGGGGTLIVKPGEEGAPSRLRAEALELDQGPLQRWAMQVVDSSSNLGASGARATLNQRWQAEVLPLCERTLQGRYPFNPGAEADVALQDFARLFAPGGLIDSFFKENLLEYVETTVKPWRFKQVNGADLGISTGVLTQFQHAADIRDSFFLGAGPPKVTFDLKPIALDSKATSVILEVEGQSLEYAHQVPETTPMTWPGQAGGRTRVAFTPQLPDAENTMSREGPWAWFRLLDAAELRQTNVSDRSRVVFNIGGRIAVFQLRAGSALNPFSLPALRSFRCITSL